ncbi:MAG: hypothetical protein KGH61_05455 [Candidatus Micrarchaeota archaeon]|nr:hypothetical protein [Candidatus Micrarchaeota archaeon]MDE1848360.1 hypothetical protein [Candidatus Micrarchaeota archaeon]MDE1864581.1 hypothetical protein [Candidatus Micrarchaeota archaeon]
MGEQILDFEGLGRAISTKNTTVAESLLLKVDQANGAGKANKTKPDKQHNETIVKLTYDAYAKGLDKVADFMLYNLVVDFNAKATDDSMVLLHILSTSDRYKNQVEFALKNGAEMLIENRHKISPVHVSLQREALQIFTLYYQKERKIIDGYANSMEEPLLLFAVASRKTPSVRLVVNLMKKDGIELSHKLNSFRRNSMHIVCYATAETTESPRVFPVAALKDAARARQKGEMEITKEIISILSEDKHDFRRMLDAKDNRNKKPEDVCKFFGNHSTLSHIESVRRALGINKKRLSPSG